MFDGRTWRNDHSKRVRFYGLFEEMPGGFRYFMLTMGAAAVCFLLPRLLMKVGVLPEVQFGLGVWLVVLLTTLLMGASLHLWHAHGWRTLESGGLVDFGSFAFGQLQDALSERGFTISQMNDRLDYSVGPQHITAFLAYTKRASRRIETKLLTPVLQVQLEGRVRDIAAGYADLIKFCFDQRELAKQARDRWEGDEARKIEVAMRDRVKRFYLDQDAIDWLSTHAAVSI